MATAGGRADSSLSGRLHAEPFRYRFFQAVRLLQLLDPASPRVGYDGPPREEAVRFVTEQSLTFPASEILDLAGDPDGGQARMVVRFMGLTGPMGVLPQHYTQLIIERLYRKDRGLAEFLDLFNHRLISLFYRAWEKYRPHLRVEPGVRDEFSSGLFCLFGMGTRGLRDRLAVPDRALLFYAGLLAQHPRSAVGLEGLLGDYFGDAPVAVRQFVGQWLALDPDSQSRLERFGGNTQLGVDTVIGARVWSTQSKFRVRLGPLTYPRFCEFLPSGAASRALLELTRYFVGQEFDFEFQLVLAAAEVPPCRLGSTGPRATRLGWSTWLSARPASADADEVVLQGKTLEAHHEAA